VYYEGSIECVHRIEALIRSGRGWRYVRYGYPEHDQIQGREFDSALFVRYYEVYVWPCVFVIQLTYDTRDNKGRFYMRDQNATILFRAMPKLKDELQNMRPLVRPGRRERQAMRETTRW